MNHKAGYINIIGRPNVGKSTLLNQWLGEKIAIVTPKAQTTRHRILGIWNDAQHQAVISDTPGIIFDPANQLHLMMNKTIDEALEDADVIVYVTEPEERPQALAQIIEKLKKIEVPKVLLINKCDTLSDTAHLSPLIKQWQDLGLFQQIFPISAIHQSGTSEALHYLLTLLPENPPFFPKDQLTDRTERFIVSEIIREKILLLYQKEIPYAVQVEIDSFQEEENIIKIKALIFTERESQKMILIGKNGTAIKKLGTEARLEIEKFLGKKVFLELQVKVREKWRNNLAMLKKFGYSR